MSEEHPCPLCRSRNCEFFARDKRRCYQQCRVCNLVFVPPQFHLPDNDEKAVYDCHENNPNDAGYRKFLGRLADPLLGCLPANSHGLDFGCGPGPALHLLLEEAGHRVALYDKFYARDPDVLANHYDFITATEVVEHLHEPGDVLTRLWHSIHPNGYLAVMTKRVTSRDAFINWHYKNDPTHIAFFSEITFAWLADKWQARLCFYGPDVAIFHKASRA